MASTRFRQMHSDSIAPQLCGPFQSIFVSLVWIYTELNATSLNVARTSYFKIVIALSSAVLTFSNSGNYRKKGCFMGPCRNTAHWKEQEMGHGNGKWMKQSRSALHPHSFTQEKG